MSPKLKIPINPSASATPQAVHSKAIPFVGFASMVQPPAIANPAARMDKRVKTSGLYVIKRGRMPRHKNAADAQRILLPEGRYVRGSETSLSSNRHFADFSVVPVLSKNKQVGNPVARLIELNRSWSFVWLVDLIENFLDDGF